LFAPLAALDRRFRLASLHGLELQIGDGGK
jgi:hypothetical protein